MSDVELQSSLRLFTPLSCPDTASHVIKLVRSASAKQSSLDPTPKWLLEDCIDLISPYLTRRAKKHDHIKHLLRDRLHWLPIPQRVQFKLCLLTLARKYVKTADSS